MGKIDHPLSEDLTEPVTIGAEAFLSRDYAEAEREKLWRKVWQVACRLEEVAEVGDYVVYDILGDTILVTRNQDGELSAFYNVCSHRGKKLAKGCGRAMQFRCSYHAWRYNLKGENIFVLDKEDWGDVLPQERLDLPARGIHRTAEEGRESRHRHLHGIDRGGHRLRGERLRQRMHVLVRTLATPEHRRARHDGFFVHGEPQRIPEGHRRP